MLIILFYPLYYVWYNKPIKSKNRNHSAFNWSLLSSISLWLYQLCRGVDHEKVKSHQLAVCRLWEEFSRSKEVVLSWPGTPMHFQHMYICTCNCYVYMYICTCNCYVYMYMCTCAVFYICMHVSTYVTKLTYIIARCQDQGSIAI